MQFPVEYIIIIAVAIVLIIALNVGGYWLAFRNRNRAEAACRSVVGGYFGRVRMMDDASLADGPRLIKRGCLALLGDRLLFRPVDQDQIMEVPLAQIHKVGLSRAQLVIALDNRSLAFYLNPEVAVVWRMAIEKSVWPSGDEPARRISV